jgi:hypothetical protein
MPMPAGAGPQIGRLSLREEGENWNAYYAPVGTMEGAIFLGSIRMGLVATNAERKKQFMDLMRECLGDVVFEATGVRPVWGGPERAPQHERSGNA